MVLVERSGNFLFTLSAVGRERGKCRFQGNFFFKYEYESQSTFRIQNREYSVIRSKNFNEADTKAKLETNDPEIICGSCHRDGEGNTRRESWVLVPLIRLLCPHPSGLGSGQELTTPSPATSYPSSTFTPNHLFHLFTSSDLSASASHFCLCSIVGICFCFANPLQSSPQIILVFILTVSQLPCYYLDFAYLFFFSL